MKAILSTSHSNKLYLLSVSQVLGLKSALVLMSFGIGQGLGLDREVRELYTVIVAAEERPPSQEVTFASVSYSLPPIIVQFS